MISADVKADVKQNKRKKLVAVSSMRSTFKNWNAEYHQACIFI